MLTLNPKDYRVSETSRKGKKYGLSLIKSPGGGGSVPHANSGLYRLFVFFGKNLTDYLPKWAGIVGFHTITPTCIDC